MAFWPRQSPLVPLRGGVARGGSQPAELSAAATGLFALTLALSIGPGCRVPNENHCGGRDGSQRQLDFCAENHADQARGLWVCTASTCETEVAAIDDDGCRQLETLAQLEIDDQNGCILAWPDPQADSDDADPTLPSQVTPTSDDAATTGADVDTDPTGSTDVGDETEATNTEGSSTSMATGDDATATTDGSQCLSNADCSQEPLRPICDLDSGACVGCLEDMHCPDAERCDQDTQTCVDLECLENRHCTAIDRPICGDDNECEPCTQIAGQCDGAAACDPRTGRCFPESAPVLRVDADDPDCRSSSGGNDSKPWCSLAAATDELVATDQYVATIVLHAAGQPYAESLDLAGPNWHVALIGEGAPVLAGAPGSSSPAVLSMSQGARSIVAHLEVADSEVAGISCHEGDVWLESIRLLDNSGAALAAESCMTRVEHSEIHTQGQSPMISQLGGELQLDSSLLVRSGAASVLNVQDGAIEMTNMLVYASPSAAVARDPLDCGDCPRLRASLFLDCVDCQLSAVYSTILLARDYRLMQCDTAVGEAELSVRNSVVIHTTGPKDLDNSDCEVVWTQNLRNFSSNDPGNTDIPGAPPIEAWFRNPCPTDGSFPDLRLRSASEPAVAELSQVALRSASDPAVDIDGNVRPLAGSPDYPGAHRAQ